MLHGPWCSSSAMAQPNALLALNEWAQKQKTQLSYTFSQLPAQQGQSQGLHVCTLQFRIQAGGVVGELPFKATGSKKQDAKQFAAAAALQHLRTYPLNHPEFFSAAAAAAVAALPDVSQAASTGAGAAAGAAEGPAGGTRGLAPPKPFSTLTEAAAMSASRAYKDAPFKELAEQSGSLWGRWAPLSLLCLHGKGMRAFMRAQHGPSLVMDDLHAVTAAAAVQLARERATATLPATSPASEAGAPAESAGGRDGASSDHQALHEAAQGGTSQSAPLAQPQQDEQQGQGQSQQQGGSLVGGFKVCPSGFAFMADPPSPAPIKMDEPSAAPMQTDTQTKPDVAGAAVGAAGSAGAAEPDVFTAAMPSPPPPPRQLGLAAAVLGLSSPRAGLTAATQQPPEVKSPKAVQPPTSPKSPRGRRRSFRIEVAPSQQGVIATPPAQVSALLLLPLSAASQHPASSSCVQEVSLVSSEEKLVSQIAQILAVADSADSLGAGDDAAQQRVSKSPKHSPSQSPSQSKRSSADGGAPASSSDAADANASPPPICQRLVVWGGVGVRWHKVPAAPSLCTARWEEEPKVSAAFGPIAPVSESAGDGAAASQPEARAVQDRSSVPSEVGEGGSEAPGGAAGIRPMPLESQDMLDLWSLMPSTLVTQSNTGSTATAGAAVSGSSDGAGVSTDAAASQHNPIASWLAGAAVRGPALVTLCRPRRKPAVGEPRFLWRSLTKDDLWRACAALLPAAFHTASRHSHYIGQLPLKYESSSTWVGAVPKALLFPYWQRHLAARHVAAPRFEREAAPAPAMTAAQAEGDIEDEEMEDAQIQPQPQACGTVRVQLATFAMAAAAAAMGLSHPSADRGAGQEASQQQEAPITASAEVLCKSGAAGSPSESDWADAEQRAALALLHKLHAADVAVLHALAASAAPNAVAKVPAEIVEGPTQSRAGPDPMPATAAPSATVSSNPAALSAAVQMEIDAAEGAAAGGHAAAAGATAGSGSSEVGTTAAGAASPAAAASPQRLGLAAAALAKSARERDLETEVQDEGATNLLRVGPGMMVKCAFKLWQEQQGDQKQATAGNSQQPVAGSYVLVEDVGSARFLVGSRAVRPELEQLISGLGKGAIARCQLLIPAGGPDPLGILPPTCPAVLEARVLSISNPAHANAAEKVQLFSPNLGLQRRQLVAALLARYGVRSLVDVGCGEGSLITYLLRQLDERGAWAVVKEGGATANGNSTGPRSKDLRSEATDAAGVGTAGEGEGGGVGAESQPAAAEVPVGALVRAAAPADEPAGADGNTSMGVGPPNPGSIAAPDLSAAASPPPAAAPAPDPAATSTAADEKKGAADEPAAAGEEAPDAAIVGGDGYLYPSLDLPASSPTPYAAIPATAMHDAPVTSGNGSTRADAPLPALSAPPALPRPMTPPPPPLPPPPPARLESIIGIDISERGLSKATKSLSVLAATNEFALGAGLGAGLGLGLQQLGTTTGTGGAPSADMAAGSGGHGLVGAVAVGTGPVAAAVGDHEQVAGAEGLPGAGVGTGQGAGSTAGVAGSTAGPAAPAGDSAATATAAAAAPTATELGGGTLALDVSQAEDKGAQPKRQLPNILLAAGSAFSPQLTQPEAWGQLCGVDAAVMIEVIEHLDPGPLSLVPPCLLGGLRPRVAIISTPNWEYNSVMRKAETKAGSRVVWPGPPGRDGLPLRCNDHRFEWTRAEFETWAKAAAALYGYQVSFVGVGQVQPPATSPPGSARQSCDGGSQLKGATVTAAGGTAAAPAGTGVPALAPAAGTAAGAPAADVPMPGAAARGKAGTAATAVQEVPAGSVSAAAVTGPAVGVVGSSSPGAAAGVGPATATTATAAATTIAAGGWCVGDPLDQLLASQGSKGQGHASQVAVFVRLWSEQGAAAGLMVPGAVLPGLRSAPMMAGIVVGGGGGGGDMGAGVGEKGEDGGPSGGGAAVVPMECDGGVGAGQGEELQGGGTTGVAGVGAEAQAVAGLPEGLRVWWQLPK